jgi:hypothetical protein
MDISRFVIDKEDIKKSACYAAGAYIGYHTIKYAWWKYKNSQVRAKAARVR